MGPAERALRRSLSHQRERLPPLLRRSLLLGFGLFVAYGCILIGLAMTGSAHFERLSQFFFLHLLGGREGAMLFAFQDPMPMPRRLVVASAILGDVATMLVGVPFYWWALSRLRTVPFVDAYFVSLERKAHRRRAFLDRFGLVGLAVFVWLPAWGTGILVAGAIGLIARLPLVPMYVTLTASASAVNVFWAFSLREASRTFPSTGIWNYLPFVVVSLVLLLAFLDFRRERARGGSVPIAAPANLSSEDVARLARHGFRQEGDLLLVDCESLGRSIGSRRDRRFPCAPVAELLLVEELPKEQAVALARIGISGLRDLAHAPPWLVSSALGERGGRQAPPESVARWAAGAARLLGTDDALE